MTKKEANKSNSFYLLNHSLSFKVRNSSLLSAASVLSHSPMAYNTTASLDKLTCIEYVYFGNCQNRFVRFGPKISTTWMLNLKSPRETTTEIFAGSKMGEADFNRFILLRNQLVIATENFAREGNLSAVLIPTLC